MLQRSVRNGVLSLFVFVFPVDFITVEKEVQLYLNIFGLLCDEKTGEVKITWKMDWCDDWLEAKLWR